MIPIVTQCIGRNLAARVKIGLGRLTALPGALTLLLLVGACSTNFFYDRIDTLIVWQVDDYVSLDKDQKAELKRRVGEYLNVVRHDEVPKAALLLSAIADDIESGAVTPQMIDTRFQEMLVMTEEVVTGIVPDSEWLLQSLSDKQVQELAQSLDELNDEMYGEYSGTAEEERRERRNKSSVSAIQRFTGRLTDAQKELVTGALERMTDSSEQWIEYQREWQRQFIDLVANTPPSEEFRERLTVLLVYPRSLHPPEYRAAVEANRAIFNSMMADLLNGLSDAQRTRMTKTIQEYAETLTRLAETSAK
jgi:adenylate kinase family enzyme